MTVDAGGAAMSLSKRTALVDARSSVAKNVVNGTGCRVNELKIYDCLRTNSS